MIRYLDHNKMGHSNLGWLQSRFHFSFSDYYNPNNMHFGTLRVLNDDIIMGKSGFDTHPHSNMEILTYVVRGALTHVDSMGNENTITRGMVQYMSAGTGITHSEYNLGEEAVRSLQIWIVPREKDLKPNYGDWRVPFEDRKNKWLHMVSSYENNAPIGIYQDANIYSLALDEHKKITFDVQTDRQAYMILIEGDIHVTEPKDEAHLYEGDALEIVETTIEITANNSSHLLLIEMAKS